METIEQNFFDENDLSNIKEDEEVYEYVDPVTQQVVKKKRKKSKEPVDTTPIKPDRPPTPPPAYSGQVPQTDKDFKPAPPDEPIDE